MSIFNPWGELRAIKARLAAEEEAYLIEEAQQQADWAKKDALLGDLERANATLRREQEALRNRITELNAKLSQSVRRDPKTGRYLKQGQ